MKRINRLMAILLAALLGLSTIACQKEPIAPPLKEPTVTMGDEKVITIAQYKEKFESVGTTITAIEEDLAIRAVVVGNDISGNIYKQLYVQDATGGISIGIDQNNISNDYQVGQEVYIKLKGLAVTSYGGVIQIGWKKGEQGDPKNTRIPWETAKEHIQKDGYPKEENAQPKKVTIDQVSDALVGTLVELEEVHFDQGGMAYADKKNDKTATNRELKDGKGNRLIVRNSVYATFAEEPMPKGKGTVVGILSKYNKDYQLFLRSADDCRGFNGKEPGSGNDEGNTPNNPNPGAATVIYSESFTADLGKMTPKNAAGAQGWRVNTQYKNANMSGYAQGASHANEDWLISPTFDLTAAQSMAITFKHTINKGDVSLMQQEQTLWISSDYQGDVNTATWTQLTIPTYPEGTSWKYVESGEISVPTQLLGQANVVFAFKYLCTDRSSASWQIQDLRVTSEGGKLAEGSNTPNNPNTPAPNPNPNTPTPGNSTPTMGEPLYPGSDFNDWDAFLGGLNSYGLTNGEKSENGGIDGSCALHVSGTTGASNGYLFTATVPAGLDAAKVKKITFYIKGTAEKSLSINVYKASKEAMMFNLGDVSSPVELDATGQNNYIGTINANDWVKITLNLPGPIISEQGANLIAFKYGKKAMYDLYIDNISYE